MKKSFKDNNKLIALVVVVGIILTLTGIGLLQRKKVELSINVNELSFILEFDKDKQNNETDQFIKENIEAYFLKKEKEIVVKDLDYNLTKVSKGTVVELKDDESIKRFIKQDSETEKAISQTDIKAMDTEDFFIGKAVSEDDVEFEFQYRVYDTDFPIIKSDDEFKLSLNSEDEFKKMVSASDGVEGEVKIETEGNIDWNKVGTYDLVLKASNRNGNVSQKKVKLTLIDETKKEDTLANVNTNVGGGSSSENKGSAGKNGNNKVESGSTGNNSQSQAKPQPQLKPEQEEKLVCESAWTDKNKPCDAYIPNDDSYKAYSAHDSFNSCQLAGEKILDEMWDSKWVFDGREVSSYMCADIALNDPYKGNKTELFLMGALYKDGRPIEKTMYLNPQKKMG